MTKDITAFDRIASSLSYITAGWFGLIYCVILALQKKKLSKFLRYNVYQSIFIVLLVFLCCAIFGLLFNILSHIPIIQILVSWVQLILFKPVIFGRSILQLVIGFVVLYSAAVSLTGKEPRIYWISGIIDYNMK